MEDALCIYRGTREGAKAVGVRVNRRERAPMSDFPKYLRQWVGQGGAAHVQHLRRLAHCQAQLIENSSRMNTPVCRGVILFFGVRLISDSPPNRGCRFSLPDVEGRAPVAADRSAY